MKKVASIIAISTVLGLSSAVMAADGQQIYQSSCQACHATGAAGAPKLGDKEAWAPRGDHAGTCHQWSSRDAAEGRMRHMYRGRPESRNRLHGQRESVITPRTAGVVQKGCPEAALFLLEYCQSGLLLNN